MKRTILCLSLLALSFTACKNEEKSTKDNSSKERTEQLEKETTENLPLAFGTENQYEIARLYLDLKTKLVEDNSYGAKKIAEIMVKKLSDEQMKSSAQKIVDNEKKIENQRDAFFQLSKMLEPIFAKNITGGKLYKQYCPMAFDGKGAFWFSTEEKIMNPYFGDKMLNCGEIKKVVK